MPRDADGDDARYGVIRCSNTVCASNGGDNASALLARLHPEQSADRQYGSRQAVIVEITSERVTTLKMWSHDELVRRVKGGAWALDEFRVMPARAWDDWLASEKRRTELMREASVARRPLVPQVSFREQEP